MPVVYVCESDLSAAGGGQPLCSHVHLHLQGNFRINVASADPARLMHAKFVSCLHAGRSNDPAVKEYLHRLMVAGERMKRGNLFDKNSIIYIFTTNGALERYAIDTHIL